MKAICGYCGKKVTLVHKLKSAPDSSRLRRHTDRTGRNCYGWPKTKVEK